MVVGGGDAGGYAHKGAAIEADMALLARSGAAEQNRNRPRAMLNQLHNEKPNAWWLTHIHDGVDFFLLPGRAPRRW